MEAAGSWIPMFRVAVGCDALAAILALLALKPPVAKITHERLVAPTGIGPARVS